MSNLLPIDWAYIEWLSDHVGLLNHSAYPEEDYQEFAVQLYKTEFLWKVSNDDNRVENAKELRQFFLQETREYADASWRNIGCSMLELLVVLSQMGSFETDESPHIWFDRMVRNARLEFARDCDYGPDLAEHNQKILNQIIQRTYLPNGTGGLFPLKNTPFDQRKVELWYQLSAYILESYSDPEEV